MKSAARLIINKLPKLKVSFARLTQQDVLVGVPQEDSSRKPEPGGEAGMNNATLAYIHDNGSPAQNIPARPFMHQGIEEAKPQVAQFFKHAAQAAASGNDEAIARDLHKAGLSAQSAIRGKINEGIGPPLALSTLKARARKGSKGAKVELESRSKGEEPSMENAKPLVYTGQLRNSINYVVRKAGRGTT